MEQIRPFVDERLAAFCYACAGPPTTRDHVPARVFLDKPYPKNLSVIGSCRSCNEGASLDEEYLACLLEVAACGSASPPSLARPKIRAKLASNPPLAARLGSSFRAGGTAVLPEHSRVARVLEKMGRALWAFEAGEPTAGMTARVASAPLESLTTDGYAEFLKAPAPDPIPEVGSRLMFRVFVVNGSPTVDYWQEVQAERFSYAVTISRGRNAVKMILRDYLAAEVELDRTD